MKTLISSFIILVPNFFLIRALLPSKSPILRLRNNYGRNNINDNIIVFLQRSENGRDENYNKLTHKDIVWKLRPGGRTSRMKRLWLRIAANVIRLDCFVFRKDSPPALCPKGGQAVLEAHTLDDSSNRLIKVGRFGFTTERGAPAEQIQDTVHDIYNVPNNYIIGVAAIIYMYVEPQYRKKGIGDLALEVIGFIHSIQGVDFTVLCCDDDGSGKLIDWYSKNGYSKAPKLQNLLGSPDAVHGVTMIAPTNSEMHEDCVIKWW